MNQEEKQVEHPPKSTPTPPPGDQQNLSINSKENQPVEIHRGRDSDGNGFFISKAEDELLKWINFDEACQILGLNSHDAVRDRSYTEVWRNKLVKEGRNTRRYFLLDDVEQSRKKDLERYTQGLRKGLESIHSSTPEVSKSLDSEVKSLEIAGKIGPMLDIYQDLQKKLGPIIEDYQHLQKTVLEKDKEILHKEESIGKTKEQVTKYRILSKTGWICLGIAGAVIILSYVYNVPNKFWREKETITITKEIPVIKKETEIKLIPVDKETYEDLKAKGLIKGFETVHPGNGALKSGQPTAGTNGKGTRLNPDSNPEPKNNTDYNGSATGNGKQK